MKWKTEKHSQEFQQNPRKALMKYGGNVRAIAIQIEARDTQVETINQTKPTSILTVLVAEVMINKATGQERKPPQVTIPSYNACYVI